MSTFLELVDDLHRESGASGEAPSSVVGQTGEQQRMVKWIQASDFYIQDLWLNWKFLWDQVELPTVTNVAGITAPTDLNFWDFKTFKLNDGISEDEQLGFAEHDSIKWEVRDTDVQRPSRVILMPDNNIELDPIPDQVYTLKADYFEKPRRMTQNGDVSPIPESFHPAILGRGLILYGNYEQAPEIKAQGQEIYGEYLARLENNQLPNQRYSRYQSTGSFFDVSAEGPGGNANGSFFSVGNY